MSWRARRLVQLGLLASRAGDSLLGPATYTLDAAATDRWRRFDFGRNAAVESGPWDIAFRIRPDEYEGERRLEVRVEAVRESAPMV